MPNSTGQRSTFPGVLDSWSQEFLNDVCQRVTATDWNKIQDATFKLQAHTLKTVLTGSIGTVTHTASGAARTKLLYKSYTVTLTGSPTVTKTASLSGFSQAEKDLFNGTPLASGNAIHVQVRKVAGDSFSERAYHAGLEPLNTGNFSGDAGWQIVVGNIRHGNGQETVDSGLYCVSVEIDGT